MFDFLKKEKKEEEPQVDIEQGSLICAKCHKTMNKKVHKNIVMDVCPGCGSVFLDNGELEKIEEFK